MAFSEMSLLVGVISYHINVANSSTIHCAYTEQQNAARLRSLFVPCDARRGVGVAKSSNEIARLPYV